MSVIALMETFFFKNFILLWGDVQVGLLWFSSPDLVSCGILQKPQRVVSALDP